jgi:ketosteroid isomerase-like protein
MCKEDDNKALVGRWFKDFWSAPSDLAVVDELAAPDVLLQYSPDTPRRGRDAVRAFRASLRDAFPDLVIAGASLIVDRDMVVVRWSGIGTHTGPAFDDFKIGPLPAASGRTVRLSGTTAVRVENGRIAEEAIWIAT